ncbi:LysR family transcriptional regulator [Paremcibacter congregatus]|uniref:LysR family transcriptional regulator n=1 Tax=Paremcibacter congregatus TaxID=2043170 RepID=A0A2G4YV48_9PROT|nr:LysR family transcriptional regulator [Paremcibacter congregatus]PHZ86224.1 LysR family transcriptional regulator [Paremcibacter congregatus]QDE27190.1 LysR family transcriptional regulator [Paremcibacter congregatus]|tara:strand:+ start:4428 stop:5312 length:885 start_codon:yes stop_codon:yes gene_type:complete
MDWDKLRIFHVVASAGSFTHAGEKLYLSQSAVSRQIRSLEESLNTTLFNRHARGLSLTDEGESLFKTAEEVVAKIHVTEQQLIEGTNLPRGELKITTTLSFGSTWMMNNIRSFIEKYPEINVQLLATDTDLDLTTREADVAIRFHPAQQLDLIQRQVGVFHHHLYASPEYLSRKGRPESMEELNDHNIVTYGDISHSPIRNIDWVLDEENGLKRKPILRINSIYGVLQAVKSGVGIAALPDYLVQGSTNVVRILNDIEGPAFPAYLVYTQEARNSKRIAAFKDFIIEQFKDARF